MSPVRSLKNHYRGINAHLQSRLQDRGNWAGFHTAHIGDLARLMRTQLYPMGYVAEIEDSVQVRRSGDAARAPRADVLILDEGSRLRVVEPVQRAFGDVQDMVVTIPEALVFDDIDYYKAVVIYRSGSAQDDPVAWIELLSPSNKPEGQDWPQYSRKRDVLIQGGLVFVEIDYLHESPPTLEIVSRYPPPEAHSPDKAAYPYRITVIDPHPNLYEGQVRVRSFRVDDPLPTIQIPLLGEDVLAFDFGEAYDKTFREMLYGHEVDYAELPAHFDHYDAIDQIRIVNRMLSVTTAAQAGLDLESEIPLSSESLPLDDALLQLGIAR